MAPTVTATTLADCFYFDEIKLDRRGFSVPWSDKWPTSIAFNFTSAVLLRWRARLNI